MEIQQKYVQIESLLKEIRNNIIHEIGYNPYEDLDKLMKVASQKNYNHFSSINKKLKNLSMMLYNRNLDCSDLIFKKLDELYSLINESSI